ncbi:MAG: lycopene cyclase family protein, partial [Pseudohongiellaceae bacterium]
MPTNRPDNPNSDYDLIIIGGGCSGLSLAAALCRLAVQPEHVPRTLIIEPRSRYTNDRSWCFWAQADHSNQARRESHGSQTVDMAVDLIAKSWPSWEFSAESVSHRHASDKGWNYHYVTSIRFYEQVEEQLAQNPKITLLKSTLVSEVKPVEDCLELVLESGSDVTESASRVVTA